MSRLYETEFGEKFSVPVGQHYPVTWKLIRFPREKERIPREYGMAEVWDTLSKIAVGQEVSEVHMTLASRWFGVPIVTKDIAKQLTRQGSDLKLRFPRRKHHG